MIQNFSPFKLRVHDLIQQRDREIRRIFSEKKKYRLEFLFLNLIADKREGKKIDLYRFAEDIYAVEDSVIQIVFQMSASRFWISPEECAKIISAYQRGLPDRSSAKLVERNKLLFELFQKKYNKQQSRNRSISEIAVELVELPAPSYYLSIEKIKQICKNPK